MLPSVPAAPCTTLPPWPCFGLVIPWPWADAAIKVAQAATAIARSIPLLNISPPGKRFLWEGSFYHQTVRKHDYIRGTPRGGALRRAKAFRPSVLVS